MPTATLARLASEFLRQGQRLIARIDDAAYADAVPTLSRSSVGAHIRHVLDHFSSLLEGIDNGVVDYDLRARDTAIERSRSCAVSAILDIERSLADARFRSDRELTVRVDSGERGPRAASRSSLQRELQFCIAHTVHHYAIVALLLRARGIEVEAGFGVAPSTQKHESMQQARQQDEPTPNGEGLATCAR